MFDISVCAMRQFHPLYEVFRQACRDSGTEPSLGRFLVLLDEQVLELLSQRFAAWWEDCQLSEPELDDLLLLTKAVAADEAYPLPSAEDHLEALKHLGDCVVHARLKALGFLDADIEKLTLNQDVVATPTDKAVRALGGATQLRGVTLH